MKLTYTTQTGTHTTRVTLANTANLIASLLFVGATMINVQDL